ncbi:toll/interleukin-1 receptor domain-containing protein [Streptomyces rutgersensis]|uniref:toll/interleukin-1 receptor domain-containing protein n=1 Tax=Streptomyces rutgersensis TaxID=53451 RepID=UPI0018757DEC|nr:toll/interleukin-1 receptor domain-containing protein [Streptomyces rutgersensis]
MRQQLRSAQRKAEQDAKRAQRKFESQVNKAVSDYNRTAERHNRQQLAKLRQRSGSSVSFTVEEQHLVDRVQSAVAEQDERECDVFLSYARVDGAKVAEQLRSELDSLGITVWFDEVAIRAGKSLSRQMDDGLTRARAGVTLLTEAYLGRRFWTEHELGALLHKDTVIPVLHGVSFGDVGKFSSFLRDQAGFSTDYDSVKDIAQKIAEAVLLDEE